MNLLKDFPYKHVLVLGLAKSGTAVASLLRKQNVYVRVNDKNATEDDENVKSLRSEGIEIILGSHPIHVLDDIELVVKNPGIRYDHEIIVEAEERGLPIFTEIEIASKLIDNPIIGITGSNGKTTSTTLVTQMMQSSKVPVKVAGNIGEVASEIVQTLTDHEQLVLELSSFQLMGIHEFKPHIAVMLNLFEAHLDYHKTFENYVKAKCNIFMNQTTDDYFVYNEDDIHIVAASQHVKSQKIPFSIKNPLKKGGWIDDTYLYFNDEAIIKLEDIVLVGSHNLENILAAVCAAKLSGATNEGIRHVLTTFQGVKHRLQFVDEINERLFYNDSKATNMLATEKALKSFEKPVILLCGGLDRGTDFTELIPFLENVKAIVTFGETKNRFAKLANEANIQNVAIVDKMNEAVQKAYEYSNRGDVILLSPACASWDQYPTFEKRGDMFIDSVNTLK